MLCHKTDSGLKIKIHGEVEEVVKWHEEQDWWKIGFLLPGSQNYLPENVPEIIWYIVRTGSPGGQDYIFIISYQF